MGHSISADAPVPLDPMLVERMTEVVRLMAMRRTTQAEHLASEVAYELGLVPR